MWKIAICVYSFSWVPAEAIEAAVWTGALTVTGLTVAQALHHFRAYRAYRVGGFL
jgi:hypothetical protein